MVFPANPVEIALAEVRAGRAPAERLLRALADGELWVPLAGAPGAGGETPLPVVVLDGQPYVAVYTSAEQYGYGAGDQAHMVMTGRTLAGQLTDELGLAVNPGCAVGVPVRPEGVLAIRGGRAHTVRGGQRVRLGDPAEEPRELLDALADAFTRIPAVAAARRALAQIGGRPPGLVVGVEADLSAAGVRESVLAAVDAAVAAAPLPYSVDTYFLDSASDEITAWMRSHTSPFYRRSTGTPPAG